MDFNNIKKRLKIAGWVRNFILLDIAVYIVLLLVFPNLWFIGIEFGLLIIGTIVSNLMYNEFPKNNDNTWRKPAGVLVAVNVSLSAIFCIIVSALMIIGVVIASNH